MKSTRFIALAAAALFALGAQPSFGANLLNPIDNLKDGQFGLNIVDDFVNNGTQTSRLVAHDAVNGKVGDQFLCESAADDQCQYGVHAHVYGSLLLPACEQESTWDCIESLSVSNAEGELVQATYLGETSGPIYPGDTSRKFPEGRTISRWSVPGVANAAGTATFAVKATVDANLSSANVYNLSRLSVSVLPYVEKSGTYKELTNSEFVGDDGIQRVSSSAPPTECAWVMTTTCGEMVDFAENQVLRVQLKLSNSLSGWLFGRISNPLVSVDKVDSKYSSVAVQGAPLTVAKAFGAIDLNSPGPKAQVILDKIPETNRRGRGVSNTQASNLPTEWLEAIREVTHDVSVGDYQAWQFGSISGSTGGCLKSGSGLGGLVTTNSTIYQSSAPSFESGVLKYKVAGLHYRSDGSTPVVGSYDLVIRKDVAQCMYGFTKTPTSAVVTVSSENGDLNIATAILRDEGDWIALEARGFTFSEKTIAVAMGGKTKISSTISAFKGSSYSLSSSQKNQVAKAVSGVVGVTKVICTGVYTNVKDAKLARLRAKAACTYAKSKNPSLGIWYQSKISKAASYKGRVILGSK